MLTVNRAVTAFAGVMILLSLALAHFVSPMWLWLTAFVGFNLFQSSFTGFCGSMYGVPIGTAPRKDIS